MKKYIKQLKKLPYAIVNDDFTDFQAIFLFIAIVSFALLCALGMYISKPTN